MSSSLSYRDSSLTQTEEAPALRTDGLELVGRVLTEQYIHGLCGSKLKRNQLTPVAIMRSYHHLLCGFGLAIALAKLDNGIQVEFIRILEDNLEAALIVDLAALFTQTFLLLGFSTEFETFL